MAQDLISITPFAFQLTLPQIGSKELWRIYLQLLEYCEGNIPEKRVMDLQRKASKAYRELQNRGYINVKNKADALLAEKNRRHKKKVY